MRFIHGEREREICSPWGLEKGMFLASIFSQILED